MSAVTVDDAVLVARSVAGSRSAFEQIVLRYQSLVCAVAYSATGSLHRSEDVAQDAFLTAWRHLRDLRDPERLRAWLCGITRNLAKNIRYRELREPNSGGLSVEALESVSDEAGTTSLDIAIREEEEAILWRSIGALAPTFREPLVLYYREQQSIEEVAHALDLSQEAVRQRLSRGRKLLHGEVVSFVERTLARSAPGKDFTLMVVAALPSLSLVPAGTAAAAGLGAVPGSIAAKSGLATLLLGFVGPAIGAVSVWFGVRAGLDAAPTPREKALVIRQTVELLAGSLLFALVLCLLVFKGPALGDRAGVLLLLGLVLGLGFSGWLVSTVLRCLRDSRAMRAEAGGASACREFRSVATLFGWPLYHLRFGTPTPHAPFVRGWIAMGDRSVGLLFAMGHIAIAPVSVGVIAFGGLSVGGIAAGVVPMASVAIGVLPVGGASFGLLAIGGYAAGGFGAVGGLALSLTHAAGGFAVAPHANDAIAAVWLASWLPPWLVPTLILLLAVLAIVPSAMFAVMQRRYLRPS